MFPKRLSFSNYLKPKDRTQNGTNKATVAGKTGPDLQHNTPTIFIDQMWVVHSNMHKMSNNKAHPNNKQTAVHHISHSNTPGNLIKISVRNVSKDLSINMETISLTQVSLVSRDQSLHSVETSGSGVTVSRGHSSSIIVSTAQVDSVQEKWRDVPGLVTLPANVIIPGGR